MPSPVRFRRHGRPHAHLLTSRLVLLRGGDLRRFSPQTMPAPGSILTMSPAARRNPLSGCWQAEVRARIAPSTTTSKGAPELVAEVASSSVSYDLDVKFKVYRRNGVKEYIVWRVFGSGNRLVLAQRGTVCADVSRRIRAVAKSKVFPGLVARMPRALRCGAIRSTAVVAASSIAGSPAASTRTSWPG